MKKYAMKKYGRDKDTIYNISKIIVNEILPEEKEYFDAIWEVMKEFIAKWDENIPEELIFEEYQKGLEKELGFFDESEISGFNTPKVIALINLSLLMLTRAKGKIKEEEIEETIKKYGKALPEWVRINTINLAVPLIKEDLKQIAKMAGEEVEEEEKKYVMYSHLSRAGVPITKTQYEKHKKEDKAEYYLWYDEKNEDLIIDKKSPKNVHPEEKRALVCLLKKSGDIAWYWELYGAIHDIKVEKEEWSNIRNERIGDIYGVISELFSHCPEISTYKKTERGKGYKLLIPVSVKYCLIVEKKEA